MYINHLLFYHALEHHTRFVLGALSSSEATASGCASAFGLCEKLTSKVFLTSVTNRDQCGFAYGVVLYAPVNLIHPFFSEVVHDVAHGSDLTLYGCLVMLPLCYLGKSVYFHDLYCRIVAAGASTGIQTHTIHSSGVRLTIPAYLSCLLYRLCAFHLS